MLAPTIPLSTFFGGLCPTKESRLY